MALVLNLPAHYLISSFKDDDLWLQFLITLFCQFIISSKNLNEL